MTVETQQGNPATLEDLRGDRAEFDDLVGGFITAERVAHPELGTTAELAGFAHDKFGFSTTGSTTTYTEQGRIAGQSARRVETLVTQGRDFGNRELVEAVEEVFAVASFLERRYPDLPEEAHRGRFRIAYLQGVRDDRRGGISLWDMMERGERREVIGLLARSEIFELDNHFDE